MGMRGWGMLPAKKSPESVALGELVHVVENFLKRISVMEMMGNRHYRDLERALVRARRTLNLSDTRVDL